MQHRVTAKQHTSKMCFVCGTENQFGMHASFYELENGELLALFTPKEEHQGYPERLHGGMASAILDETIGRAMMITDQTFWGVTLELTTRFRKPVPLGEELRVVARITKETSRLIEGSGEILLKDGRVGVEAKGTYLKLPIEEITEAEFDDTDDWRVVLTDEDPEEVDL